MSYKLEKPFTDAQYADFVCEHQGLHSYENDSCVIMYLDSEKIIDGVAIDISDADEYKTEILAEQNAAKKKELQSQIDKLDLKCIRAIREGGLYDSTTGKTWLEYYQEEIVDLRNQMLGL